MKKLLTLPENLVENFHDICGVPRKDWFCASDPENCKLGSGGGTVALLNNWRLDSESYDPKDRMIIMHACGESRRLPAYASVGKILTPVPVFRWATGQAIDQTLLSLQLPLYENILSKAPGNLRALIASGDVYIHTDSELSQIPDADVVCYGIWADATLASHHGVFVLDRENTNELQYMLQKPSVSELSKLSATNYFLMDIGVWLLSDRALSVLAKRSTDANGNLKYYDLYSEFGCALGANPTLNDKEVYDLTVAIVPMNGGEFYHYGTSAELLSSTLALQSKVMDQRMIFQNKVRPGAALFTQNCRMDYRLGSNNNNIWVENSHVGEQWELNDHSIITGVPTNDWSIKIPSEVCLDITPVGEVDYVIRPYGFNDSMRGKISDSSTQWMGLPAKNWFEQRGMKIGQADTDIQHAKLFPIIDDLQIMERLINWMISNSEDSEAARLWNNARKYSANDITRNANLKRLTDMRRGFLKEDIEKLSSNYRHSVFYQLDLDNLSEKYKSLGLTAPELPQDVSPIIAARNRMLNWKIGGDEQAREEASRILRDSIMTSVDNSLTRPHLNAYADQIIWSRSPVRIDLAGGWTDTPPYSLTNGANVVNMAIELNGQPPLQAFVKSTPERHILIRSIDMGASEIITDYAALTDYRHVGSPFSIPKAALALAGFAPGFSPVKFNSLAEQLDDFGCGIELTILSAVPSGSGLGTSSILASTVLAAISEFAGLSWDKSEICHRTLALEQLLTTGGGWQDQFGGVFGGVKLLQTTSGIIQNPTSLWLPDNVFTSPEVAQCHLLYYTGITRVAKNILKEIVGGMFLNKGSELRLLDSMKLHALDMADAIQRNQFERFGHLIGLTWEQNQRLDSGTNPPEVKAIINKVKDLCLGLKLPGAGGGGFIYMVAKSPEAAGFIKQRLKNEPPNELARFVSMKVSDRGLQVSRS